jgi:hypothetical protein
MGDRHEIWCRVKYDHDILTAKAPEGYEAVVDVFLVGREQPIELGWVETRRAADDPWVRFQQHNRAFDDAEEGKRHPGDVFVHVHESAILRTEVTFKQTGKSPREFEWTETEGRDGDEPDA